MHPHYIFPGIIKNTFLANYKNIMEWHSWNKIKVITSYLYCSLQSIIWCIFWRIKNNESNICSNIYMIKKTNFIGEFYQLTTISIILSAHQWTCIIIYFQCSIFYLELIKELYKLIYIYIFYINLYVHW